MVESTSPALSDISATYLNFSKALVYNPYDIDASNRQIQMCKKWDENDGEDKITGFNSNQRKAWYEKAKKDIKEDLC